MHEGRLQPGRTTLKQRLLAPFAPDLDERRAPGWSGILAQFVLVTIAALLYFGARMVTKGADATAFANARDILAFEARIGLAWEAAAQDLILHNRAVVTFFNWVYIWLHWPVILGSLLWLYRYHRARFVLLRNALFISGAIGLVFFMTFPVAPPRFLDGFTDTVTKLSASYQILQPPAIVNKYAAMPSFHVGWNVLAALSLFLAIRHRYLRFVPLASPVLMCLAVVFTANHYVIDGVVGIAVAMVGLAGAYGIRRLTHGTARVSGTPVPAAVPAVPVVSPRCPPQNTPRSRSSTGAASR